MCSSISNIPIFGLGVRYLSNGFTQHVNSLNPFLMRPVTNQEASLNISVPTRQKILGYYNSLDSSNIEAFVKAHIHPDVEQKAIELRYAAEMGAGNPGKLQLLENHLFHLEHVN
jgi:hypothetical protein